ncbi:zinc ribbon domain-containing protein [uncultured Abyssibacter sp.]|uniref:FmdB family zinc ribbon protein n=1 Tax=uncultured Abyssibacter sp. TaxID=2320202 RepID=UPI0032B2EC0E
MPIYEYVCRECGHELEALQRLSDVPLTECPSCHAATLQKKVSAAGFRLKGGGWYETDFKSSGKRNLAGDGNKSGGGGESKSGDTSSAAKSGSGGDSSSASGSKSSETKSSGTSNASA